MPWAIDVTARCGERMNIRKLAAYRRSAGVFQSLGCRQVGAVLGGALAICSFVLFAAHLQGMPPCPLSPPAFYHIKLFVSASHRARSQM